MSTPQLQAKEAVDFLKKEGLSGTAKKAADTLLATVEQAKAVPNYIGEQANQLLVKVSAAWEKLAQMPAGETRCAFSYFMFVQPGPHLTSNGTALLLICCSPEDPRHCLPLGGDGEEAIHCGTRRRRGESQATLCNKHLLAPFNLVQASCRLHA